MEMVLCVALVGLFLVIEPGASSAQSKRLIRYGDLPVELLSWLKQEGVTQENFSARISSIRQLTDERERVGEYDHLIFFLLQSSRFTVQLRIEPALSAYEFVQSLSEADRAQFLAEGSTFLPATEKIPQTRR